MRFTERSVWLQIIRGNSALDDDIGMRGHFEIDGFALDHFQRTARETARQRYFVDAIRHRLNCRVGNAGRTSDDDRRIERNSSFVTFLPVDRRMLEAAPHDAGFERAFDLPTVNSHVPDTVVRIFGNPAA